MKHAGRIVLSHGLESSPKATKVQALSRIGSAQGWQCDALDYRGQTLEQRVELLVDTLNAEDTHADPIILVGSSMGAAVSILASNAVPVDGLFLLAPAVLMPGYESVGQTLSCGRVALVHGWRDTVVPVDMAIRFGREHGVTTHLLDDDHRLAQSVPQICDLFLSWLGHWS